MRNPTHVVTARNQYFGEVGHIIAGQNNLVKVTFLMHKTKKPVFIRREALLPITPCDSTTDGVNLAQIGRKASNETLMKLINKLKNDSEEFKDFETPQAIGFVKGMTYAIQEASMLLTNQIQK